MNYMENESIARAGANQNPLISFVIFSYNHENYVREAVEAALNQDYSPLEIIISDDCSPDSSFDVISDTVKQYKGPHRVRTIRHQQNLGLAQHINEVIPLCNGSWVVFAASDDVSRHDRVTHISKLVDSQYAAFVSECDSIKLNVDESSNVSILRKGGLTLSNVVRNFRDVGAGAAYAYKLDAIRPCLPLDKCIISEDRVLPFQAAVYGPIYTSKERLVYKRSLVHSLSSAACDVYVIGDGLKPGLKALYDAHDGILSRALGANLISKSTHRKCCSALRFRKEYWRLESLKSDRNGGMSVTIAFWYYSIRAYEVMPFWYNSIRRNGIKWFFQCLRHKLFNRR